LSAVLNPAGADTQATPVADPGKVTPELAESLPYSELKARMRAEARDYEEPAADETTTPDEGGEESAEEAVTPEAQVAERDPETGRFTATPQSQDQTTTDGQRRKQYATLDEAVRDLDAVRGNLTQAAESAKALQRRVQELEAESARTRQEAEQQRIAAQHTRFESLVAQLPPEQQDLARKEYVQHLQQQAMGEYAREMQQREAQLNQREFQAAKAQVPALYKDIAKFVADQHGVPADELVALVDSPHVKALIDSAATPEAVQQASIAFGQLLDYEGSKLASQVSAAKAQRREERSATQVRDMPNGVTPGGAQQDVVTRINNMTPDQFADYKKRLLRAANR